MRRRAGLTVFVKAKVRQHSRDVPVAVAACGQLQKEVEVHGILPRFIQAISFFEDSTAEECGCRRYVQHAVVEKNEVTELDFAANAEDTASLVNPGVVAINDVDLGMLLKDLCNFFETTISISVV